MKGTLGSDQDPVLSLAASPDFLTDGRCFAVRDSGLYRSVDGGKSWQFAYQSLENAPATVVVAVSPDFASDRQVFAGVAGGILRSDDGGLTWRAVPMGMPPPLVSTLALSPNFQLDGTILAGTAEDGVFRSNDHGASWASANVGMLDMNILAIAMTSTFALDTTVAVGTESGIFQSTNGGRSWRDIDFPPELAPVLSVALSPCFRNDRTMFAGTELFGLVRSEDGGRTWTRLGQKVISEEVADVVLCEEFPEQPEIVVLHDGQISVSNDGGTSWSKHQTDVPLTEQITSMFVADRASPMSSIFAGLATGTVRRW